MFMITRRPSINASIFNNSIYFQQHLLRKSITHFISYTYSETKNVDFFGICFHTHLQKYLHFRGSPLFRPQEFLQNQITPCISKTWIFVAASSKTSNYPCYLQHILRARLVAVGTPRAPPDLDRQRPPPPPRRLVRHPSSSEEGSPSKIPLLIQEGWRVGAGVVMRGGACGSVSPPAMNPITAKAQNALRSP